MYWPCGVPQVYVCDEFDRLEAATGDEVVNVEPRVPDDTQPANQVISEARAEPKSENVRPSGSHESIVDSQLARSDQLFVTISRSCLHLWACRPATVLAKVERSSSSVTKYGVNVGVLLRPDASIVVVQTHAGYLFTYLIEISTESRVYQQRVEQSQARRQSFIKQYGFDEGLGLPEASIRFRRAIKIDAGIESALALESELIVSTSKPAAIQCIRWNQGSLVPQAAAVLLSKLDWYVTKSPVAKMVYDRYMNLSVWIAQNGRAYAVQRIDELILSPESEGGTPSTNTTKPVGTLFKGYIFHDPTDSEDLAIHASINARFSLVAVSCKGGKVVVYSAKNYSGSITISHKIQMPGSMTLTGAVTCLAWSPDGYCLFAGFERGWAMWSVFGKPGPSSFTSNRSLAEINHEDWLLAVSQVHWLNSGCGVLLTSPDDKRFWKLDVARSASVACFSCSNLVRALLQSPTEIIVYRGHDLPDLTSISNEASLWHHAQYPRAYTHRQWPIKSCAISQDGRYVAIAGRRGLAHYSVQSGRWKTFANTGAENAFAVRGGLCWLGHLLIAATESEGSFELRLFSRDVDLATSTALHVETLNASVIFLGPSGEDSLLVYTYENVLYHYVVSLSPRGANLVPVGQIAFHGVVRAPTRVRSVSWILPESQLRNGDPSRDVEVASVLFLVDDKLLLLQPNRTAEGGLKYDLRVIAQHVEYYILMRDQIYFNFDSPAEDSVPSISSPGWPLAHKPSSNLLRDSLWLFDGNDLQVWTEVRDILQSSLEEVLSKKQSALSIAVDFYPLSILLTKGIVLGIESETIQRRDLNFALMRTTIQTRLFLPYMLRFQLCENEDTSLAVALAGQYEHLSYFSHALEVLLHHVLDDEASEGTDPAASMLPAVLAFLQTSLSPSDYLSTIVQCVRKTELTSWRTLFAHLPTPTTLFEHALELEDLQTASGYLIVLHGLEEQVDDLDTHQLENYVVRLMALAQAQGDFELCADLARFMIALDPGGAALKRVVDQVGFQKSSTQAEAAAKRNALGLAIATDGQFRDQSSSKRSSPSQPPLSGTSGDYFSASPGAE